jgi:NodT family efflux transporter outer membrane factor (OMF) lipoprotein
MDLWLLLPEHPMADKEFSFLKLHRKLPLGEFVPIAIAGALLAVLGGCSLAPAYEKPVVEIPENYKESGPWQPAAPADRTDRGDWWSGYHDATLDELEGQVDSANPDLAAAAARYTQARSYLDEARGGLYPQVGVGAYATKNRQSDNRPLRSASQPDLYSDNYVAGLFNYEFDLWGRVRNLVAAGEANTQASAADLASVRLRLHAELANAYISLRGLDALAKLFDDTVDAYGKALQLTQNRHAGGIASALDVAHAQTQLDTARAQRDDVLAQRALLEHAIATLVGTPTSKFALAPKVVELPIPVAPTGLPSTLLERRPDVAAAERRTAAANAQIGVARTAFFPSITLTALGGYENTGDAGWLSAPNSVWSIGPRAFLTLFDGGRRDAEVERARAVFEEAGQRYRSVALSAFQQVEDSLALLHLLGDEAVHEDAAVASAQRTLDLALDRYRNGAVNYLEVVEAQTAALQAQRTALAVRDRRLRASVALVRALGGGWSPESGLAVAVNAGS